MTRRLLARLTVVVPLVAPVPFAAFPGEALSALRAARPAVAVPRQARPSRQGFLTGAQGARIFYRVVGTGEDTVVVVHGGPGAGMNSVLPDLEPLAEGFTVIFYDQRGGGRSELPADTSRLHARYHVGDLEAVRLHFGLDRLNVVAHSFGAVLVARYARRYPDRLKRIVFHGATGPRRAEAAGIARARTAGASSGRADSVLERRAAALLRALLDGTAADPVEACREYEALDRRLARARGGKVTWSGTTCAAPPEAVRYYYHRTARIGPRSFGDWDFTTGLGEVTASLLVVYGARDSLALPAQRAWAEAVPHGRLLAVPRAGKAAVSDRPGVVVPAVTRFLRGRWPEGAEPTAGEEPGGEARGSPGEVGAPPVSHASCRAPRADFRRVLARADSVFQGVGSQAAVLRDGELAVAVTHGFSDLEHRVPVTARTRFQVASVTKAVTGLALLRLWEEGRIDLDAPVQTYVPAFPEKRGRVTPRLLAAHLGGVRHYRDGERTPNFLLTHYERVTDALSLFAADSLVAPPGEEYVYSSYGYDLLAAAIEAAAGEPFTAYVARTIFGPLGMTRTRFGNALRPVDDRAEGYTFYYPWYSRSADSALYRVPWFDYSYNMGGGNVLSTATDLARLGRAAIRPGLLAWETLDRLARAIRPGRSNWTFGWVVEEVAGGIRLVSEGSVPGYQATVVAYPSEDLVVAYVQNSWGRWPPDPASAPVPVREMVSLCLQGTPAADRFRPSGGR